MPSSARSRPTAVTPRVTPNRSWTRVATSCRVHRPKSKPYCRGSLPLSQRKTWAFCFGVRRGGRPVGFAESKASPPRSCQLPLPLVEGGAAEAVARA